MKFRRSMRLHWIFFRVEITSYLSRRACYFLRIALLCTFRVVRLSINELVSTALLLKLFWGLTFRIWRWAYFWLYFFHTSLFHNFFEFWSAFFLYLPILNNQQWVLFFKFNALLFQFFICHFSSSFSSRFKWSNVSQTFITLHVYMTERLFCWMFNSYTRS